MNAQKTINKFSYYCLFWAAFFLPIKTTISNIGIISLLILSILSFYIRGIRYNVLKTPFFYLSTTIALFIPLIIGTLYAPDLQKAFSQITKSVFYLFVPIILLRKDFSREKAIFWSTRGLILGSIIGMLVILILNLNEFSNSGAPIKHLLSYDFTGSNFISPLKNMHPIYLGSYYVFMLVLMWQGSFNYYLKFIISTLSLVVIVFLNSRSIYIISTLLFLIFIVKQLSIKNSFLIVTGVILFFIMMHPFLKQTYVYNKLIKGTLWELSYKVSKHNIDSKRISDSRMSRWIVSKDLIKQKPFMGHGTGSARHLLLQEYRIRKMQASLKEEYDSHNQYLGYVIEYGLMGLFFLGAFFILLLYEAFLNKDIFLCVFVILVASLCLIENFLIRNMGINFVALFGSILKIKQFSDD